MVATAGFVIWAVASSGSGGGRTTTVRIGGGLPPPTSSPIAVRLANAVGRANLGRRFRSIDMAAVAPFAWDRVYVFRDETRDDIQRRLGFEWPGAPSAVPRSGEHESLVAFVRGRTYALPQDVVDMVLDVLRHRLVLSYEALSDNVTSDYLLYKIMERIPIPVVPLHERNNVRAYA